MAKTILHVIDGAAPSYPTPRKINTTELGGAGTVVRARLLGSSIENLNRPLRLFMVTDEDSVVPLDNTQHDAGVLFKGDSGWHLAGVVRVLDLTLTLGKPPVAEEEEAPDDTL